MANFTLNSLASGTPVSTDIFLKSDQAGVLTKVPFSTLKSAIIDNELNSFSADRVSISTEDFSGYVDFCGCGRIVTFRARLAVLRSVPRNSEITINTITGENVAKYSTTIRQYHYGFASTAAALKCVIEFSINGADIVVRNPDVALAANDVCYISGAYIKNS